MKKCSVCKKKLSLENFYNSQKSIDGKGYRCKPCDAIARAKWSTDNPERSKLSSRRRQLKHQYGMSLDDYDKILISQNSMCAVCGTKQNVAFYGNNHSVNFAVDHCHATGLIRGLLCNTCNRALGLFGDDPKLLRIGAAYLEKPLRRLDA